MTQSFSALLAKIINFFNFFFKLLYFLLIEISRDCYLSLIICHIYQTPAFPVLKVTKWGLQVIKAFYFYKHMSGKQLVLWHFDI